MRKFLVFTLFSLLALSGFAQTLYQKVTINLNGTNVAGRIVRNYATYPATIAGDAAVINAITTGDISVRLTAGVRAGEVVRAKVTKPTNPTTTPASGLPGWITAVDYSFVGGELVIRGAGSIARLKFEKPDGSAFQLTNKDQVKIFSGTFYDPGLLQNQSPYTTQWAALTSGFTFKITLLQSGGTGTYSFNFTPVAGVQNYQLLGGTTTSPPTENVTTPPATVATAVYYRGVAAGNSITVHGGAGNFIVNDANPKRGMAASRPENDYVRLLTAKHRVINPSMILRTFADFGAPEQDLSAVTGGFMEGRLTSTNAADFYNELNDTRFGRVIAWKPDILYMSLGENVNDGGILTIGQAEFQARYKAWIDKLISGDPTCKVVLRTSVWGNTNFDNAMKAIAAERNYPIADLTDMWPNRLVNGLYALTDGDNGGGRYDNGGDIDKHPDDQGMVRIANEFWAKTPSNTTSSTPGGSSAQPVVAGAFSSYPGDNFSYAALPETDKTTDVFPVFEGSKIRVKLALRDQYPTSQQPGMGGAVFSIVNKDRPNVELLYNARVWNGEDGGAPRTPGQFNRIFTGQGLSECLYANPRPFYAIGETGEAAHDGSLGYNPNEVGDDREFSGRLVNYGRSGNSFYVASKPMVYGQVAVPANDVLMKKWGTVNDRALVLNYETTFSRNSNEQVVAKGQEAPCLYSNNTRNVKWYAGNNPYTNGPITTLTMPFSAGNGSGENLNGQRSGPVIPSEPWIGIFGDDGYGIGMILKDNIRAAIGYWGDGGGNLSEPNKGTGYGYIAHAMNELLDHNIKWRHRTEVVVGTVEEIRAYVYANTYRPAYKPNFKFNTPGRLGWALNSGNWDVGSGSGDHHTWDEHYTGQNRNGWKVYFGASNNAQIVSPGAIWKAADIQKIYVRMAFTGETQNWECRWVRNGQKIDGALNRNPSENKYYAEEDTRYPNNTSDRDEQRVYTQVQGDGQYRVYEFNVSSKSEWKDIISLLMFKPHATAGRYAYTSGEYAVIDWISDSPTGPTN